MRDYDCLQAIQTLLGATGYFDAVYIGGLPERQGQSSSYSAAAALEIAGWDEIDAYDDFASIDQKRSVRWTLTLMSRDPDPEIRDRKIDQLYNIAANTLDGVSFAAGCVPSLSKLRRGNYQPATPPERRMTVQGEFEYFVGGFDLHDTSD